MEVKNRFKELNLVDRVPEELWMKARNTVQETARKTIPKKRKCKKAKWLSNKAWQKVGKEELAGILKRRYLGFATHLQYIFTLKYPCS